MEMEGIITIAYAFTAVISFYGYYPTLKDLIKYKKNSANYTSYIIWSFEYIITLVYVYVVIKDLLLSIILLFHNIIILVIAFLSWKLTVRHGNRTNTRDRMEKECNYCDGIEPCEYCGNNMEDDWDDHPFSSEALGQD